MANPRTTKVASFRVPGQQHSTINPTMILENNMGGTGKEREADKAKEIQDLAKRTLSAGGLQRGGFVA